MSSLNVSPAADAPAESSCFGGGVTQVPAMVRELARLRCTPDGVVLEPQPPWIWLHETRGPFNFGPRRTDTDAVRNGPPAFGRVDARQLTPDEVAAARQETQKLYAARFPGGKNDDQLLAFTEGYVVAGGMMTTLFQLVLLLTSKDMSPEGEKAIKPRGFGFLTTCEGEACRAMPFIIGVDQR
jgi:hypothetical protein